MFGLLVLALFVSGQFGRLFLPLAASLFLQVVELLVELFDFLWAEGGLGWFFLFLGISFLLLFVELFGEDVHDLVV